MRLNIKFHPQGMTLNGPAFEAYASRVVLDNGVEVVVLARTAEAAEGVAETLGQDASRGAHVFLGQPPWYMNDTKDNSLEDILPVIQEATARAEAPKKPETEAPKRRTLSLFD